MGAVDAEGFVRKIGHIDLMAIQDPERIARQRGDRAANASDTVFTFPFFTIENVAMVDADHIIVGNDNNLPFSAGRHLTRADDNEIILALCLMHLGSSAAIETRGGARVEESRWGFPSLAGAAPI
jgi:hypothetical protein